MDPDPPPPYSDAVGSRRRRRQQRAVTVVQELPTPESKSLKIIRRLNWVEFIVSVLMILCDSIVDGVISSSDWFPDRIGFPCTGATGIYVGVVGVLAAGLGFFAYWNQNANLLLLRCAKIFHFVMTIGIAIADVFLLRFAIICVVKLNPPVHESSNSTTQSHKDVINGMTAAESILLVAAFTHLICSIVSIGFICREFCRKSVPSYAVYCPNPQEQVVQATSGNGADPGTQAHSERSPNSD